MLKALVIGSSMVLATLAHAEEKPANWLRPVYCGQAAVGTTVCLLQAMGSKGHYVTIETQTRFRGSQVSYYHAHETLATKPGETVTTYTHLVPSSQVQNNKVYAVEAEAFNLEVKHVQTLTNPPTNVITGKLTSKATNVPSFAEFKMEPMVTTTGN